MADRSDTLKEKAISSIGWKLLEKGGSQFVKLAVQIVMARVLAPEQFGMLAIMLVFVNVGNVIVQSGLNSALVQDPDVTEDDYSTVFWLSFVVSIVLYIALFAAAPAVAAFYALPDLTQPLRAVGLILIINAYNAVQIGKLTRDLEMKKIFVGTIVSTATSSVLGIGSALAGCGVWALAIQQLSYQASNVVAHAVQIDWHPRLVFSVRRARVLFAFGWKILVSGLLNSAYQSLASLVVGKQFNSYQLGLFSQGEKYPQALGTMLDGTIQPIVLSTIAKTQRDLAYARRIMRRALKTSVYLVFPAMAFCAVIAPNLVPLLLGEQWLDCVPFFQLFCIAYALLPMQTTNLQTLLGMGRSDLFLRLEIVKMLIGATLILMGAFVFQDLQILAGGYVLASVLSSFVNAVPNKNVVGYSYLSQVRDVAPSVALTAVACVTAWLVSFSPLDGIVLMLTQAVVFAACYLGLSALFRIEEFTYLLNEIGGRVRSRATR